MSSCTGYVIDICGYLVRSADATNAGMTCRFTINQLRTRKCGPPSLNSERLTDLVVVAFAITMFRDSMAGFPGADAAAPGLEALAHTDALASVITYVTLAVSIIRIVRVLVETIRWLAALRRSFRSPTTRIDDDRSENDGPSKAE